MTFEAVLARPHLQPVPLAAVALAILLHVGTGAALWWISPDQPADVEDEPIMVMFDSSPSNAGLQQPQRAGPPPEAVAAAAPAAPEPAAADQQQQALAKPEARPEPQPSLPVFEFSIPPVTEPPPAPTSRDFIKPVRPPPRAVQRLPVLPPRPSAPPRPPVEQPATMPSPVPGPEPGDVLAGRGRQRNDYLTRLFRHLEPYRFDPANARSHHGRVVTRVTIARDGRVLDVSIASSSGSPALDAAEVAAIRMGSPFPPLPAAMPGDPVILVLPINY